MKNKFWASLLALTVIVTGALTVAGCDKNENKQANDVGIESTFTETDGMEISESQSSNMHMMSAKIGKAQYASYGVSPQAESAYTVTATITPDSMADYTELVWTAAFYRPSASWATGKVTSDYIRITPVDDLAHQVVVECLQPFSETILIKAELKDSPGIFATCECGYIWRYDTATAKLEDGTLITFEYDEVTHFTFETTNAGNGKITFTGLKNGTGTRDTSVFGLSMEISDVLVQKLRVAGFTVNNTVVDYGKPLYSPQLCLSMYGYDTMLYLPGADKDIVGETQSDLIKQGYLWATTGTNEKGALTQAMRDAYNNYRAALLEAWNESEDFLVSLILTQYDSQENRNVLRVYETQMDIVVDELFPVLDVPAVSLDCTRVDF